MNAQNNSYEPTNTNGDTPPVAVPQIPYPQSEASYPYPQQQAYPPQQSCQAYPPPQPHQVYSPQQLYPPQQYYPPQQGYETQIPYHQQSFGNLQGFNPEQGFGNQVAGVKTRQFSVGTVLFPLAFMAIHMIIQVIVAFAVALVVGMSSVTDISNDVNQFADNLMEQMGSITMYSLLFSAPIQIAIYVLAGWLMKERSKPSIYFKAPRVGDTLRAAVIAIGFIGVANLIMYMFQELSKQSRFIETQYRGYLESAEAFSMGGNIWLSTLTLVVLVPIAEELLFRGLISGEFRRAMPDWLNILLTGLLFALFHMNFIQIIYVLPAGMVLSAVGLWSRSIWVPIVLHAVYNFFGSTALMLIGDNESLAELLLWLQIVCFVASLGLLFWSYKARKAAAGNKAYG